MFIAQRGVWFGAPLGARLRTFRSYGARRMKRRAGYKHFASSEASTNPLKKHVHY